MTNCNILKKTVVSGLVVLQDCISEICRLKVRYDTKERPGNTKALVEKLLKMPEMNDMQLWEDTVFDVQLGFHDDDWHIATGRCKCGEDIHDAVRYSTERQALEAAYIRQCFGDAKIEFFDECEDCRLNGRKTEWY